MTQDTPESITFQEGVMWDGPDWRMEFEVRCDEYSGCGPCKHCHSDHLEIHTPTCSERVWVCPRVVVATNEGGYATTGVCLDCILDAAETLK